MRLAIEEPPRGHLLPLLAFAVLLFWEVGYAANLPPRTVTVKIAADSEFIPFYDWQPKFFRIFTNCAQVFERRFGIQLKLGKFVYWKPDPKCSSLRETLLEMTNNIGPDGSDILLGICSPTNAPGSEYGLTDYFNGVVVLKYLDRPKSMELLLLHELCHVFGAVDIDEEGSVMDVPYSGVRP